MYMDTVVDIQVVTEQPQHLVEASIDRAFAAFRKVEDACSRFSQDSELMIACRRIAAPVPVSSYLFEPLRFALEIAEWTNGVFDPTVGKTMEECGFNRHYLSGEVIESFADASVTYRDIVMDEHNRTLYLKKPMVIDLGAVAKGFAIDLASRELQRFERFVVNAGGDLYAGGSDERRNVWKIGIQHPERAEQNIHIVEITNEAICTSGSYERKSSVTDGVHHIIHPRTKRSPNDWVSCTVIAPFAMMADAFSTAAFLLGEEGSKALIEQAELKGILISSQLQIMKIGEV
ncbi:FAD:protein FMN transferase [Cohnella endophytica]|nr:FAD:protein FMN transferase [Cohnella endophytica]